MKESNILFYECPYAQTFWHAMNYVFGIKPRRHTLHLFNRWSKSGGAKHNQVIIDRSCSSVLGNMAYNDSVFDKYNANRIFFADTLQRDALA
jgi:hypothetical protein